MLEVIHVRLEKIGGPLKGDIEGDFVVSGPNMVDMKLPIIYKRAIRKAFVFEQGELTILMEPVNKGVSVLGNYFNHFQHGVNFLIKEWSYGRGEGIKHTGSPN